MLAREILRLHIETSPGIRSEQTERLFEIVVGHFEKFLGRPADCADFTERKVVSFMRHRRRLGKADATIDNEAKKLLILWRVAAREGRAPAPRIAIRRRKADSPHALLKHEIRALFRAAHNARGTIGGIDARIFFSGDTRGGLE